MKQPVRINERLSIPLSELQFRSSRSGGPGGQIVNKLETRVELLFDVRNSPSLNEDQRQAIFASLASKIGRDGVLRVVAQEARSQWENKQKAVEKFVAFLQKALKPKRKRIATTPTASARLERLKAKKIRSEKKKLRKVSLE
jgi:ribosome-associated protein